jgi:hypothetical protein
MRVKCISKEGRTLPYLYLDPEGGYAPDSLFELTRDREYVVYALTVRRGAVWYYVLDESGVPYPTWHPAALFEITDPRTSRYWTVGIADQGLQDGSAVVAFAQWANDPLDFYGKLTDGDAEASATFAKIGTLMDREFAGIGTVPGAEDISDGWLYCPVCRWTWQQPIRREHIGCPHCHTLLNNAAFQ